VAYFAASVDTPEKNKEFAESLGADYPILADPDKSVAEAYGVLAPEAGLARRWTFYVGKDGKILFVDKEIKVDSAGADIVAKLAELGIPKASGEKTRIGVKAGTLIDGSGGVPVRNAVILIEGDRIKSVTPAGGTVPAGTQVIDLMDSTVLPGFIDMHTHLTASLVGEPGWDSEVVRDAPADMALRGAFHAWQALQAGFTTVREVGAFGFSDVALKNAINKGFLPGPRMLVSAHAIGATGGHCDNSGFVPNLFGHEPGIAEGIANGAAEVRSAVRYQAKYGADWIKICATGGVISVGDAIGAQQYSAEELQVAADTAHLLGRRIAAHAHSTAGIKAAVRAGFDSIEHGSFLDDEAIHLMLEHKTFLVSTLMAGDAVGRMAHDGRLTGEYAAKALAIAPAMPKSLARAAAAGVRIALGTDNIFDPHTTDAREYTLLVAAGLSPMQAILAGSKNAADLSGWGADIGAIQPGRYADLVAVKGNPLEDIRVLENVRFVMKGGVVVKSDVR
jgi:imidazolonepropionase-like amidohydrolase